MSYQSENKDLKEEIRLKNLTNVELIDALEVELDKTNYNNVAGEMGIRFMQSIMLLGETIKLITSLAENSSINEKEIEDLLVSLTCLTNFTENGSRK